MKRGYKQGPEHPCSMCGLPTRSKLPVCYRPGKCRTECGRLKYRAKNGLDLSEPCHRPDSPTHPCSMCGQMTTSRFPPCARPGKCLTEYGRLKYRAENGLDLSGSGRTPQHPCSACGEPATSVFPICRRPSCGRDRDRQDKDRRNAAVRRSRQAQKGAPSVYAVWFPAPRILKVGFTVHTQDSIFVSNARNRAKRRGWEIDGGQCIWKQPGDMRTEAWMQATLSFRWRAAFEQTHDRLCEWFRVPGLTENGVVEVLDEVYRLVPADSFGIL